jgi:hypothetical protein
MSDHINFREQLSNPTKVIPLFNTQTIPPLKHEKPTSKMGPIETQMRAKLETLSGSKYPDKFNWGMYDEIASRYGDKQPRGGVVFKTAFKLVNYHTSCSKCHYALEVDSWSYPLLERTLLTSLNR